MDEGKTINLSGSDAKAFNAQVNNVTENKAMNDVIAKKDRQIQELRNRLEEKERKIVSLRNKIDEKDLEIKKLRTDISDKYQSYIDNYESIGGLIYESKIRSDKMVKDAENKKDRILAAAEAEARKVIQEADDDANRREQSAQDRVDEIIADGQQKYDTVQGELLSVVDMINQVQKRFMEAYKDIHKIVSELPQNGSDDDDDDDNRVEDEDF
ncbi:MAG TPA: hypothetical protein DCM49_02185 [Lachnospiraceae bacterium]|nr:hypothetical protein [Lachnospiraceae bacterium]